jgi:hypothetical protein
VRGFVARRQFSDIVTFSVVYRTKENVEASKLRRPADRAIAAAARRASCFGRESDEDDGAPGPPSAVVPTANGRHVPRIRWFTVKAHIAASRP